MTALESPAWMARAFPCWMASGDGGVDCIGEGVMRGKGEVVAESLINYPDRGLSLEVHWGQPIHDHQDHEQLQLQQNACIPT